MDKVLEGLLFLVGDDGIELEEIMNILDKSKEDSLKLIRELKTFYDDNDRAVTIECLGSKYKLVTRAIHYGYYTKLVNNVEAKELSQSFLETLAIIAYNEPVTRSQVDEIRGVDSSYVIRRLLLRDFVCEDGRLDIPGRPILYKTTSKFLDYFGLKSKEDLPIVEIESKEEDEVDIFNSKYKEDV
ncbi:MAG: SMC-Scp complex subunit ScpB [Bacilli bacterium]|nr:SMC-Scp complex subunit ScpB [Bacilli bacterium]